VFVRHALPGERVRARVTEGREGDSFWRADAVEILERSPDRVTPPCPHAGPGACGGCDWQHASLDAQRRIKASVLTEQLRRVGGIDRAVEVEELPGRADGSGWRTRVRFAVDAAGRPGLRRYRSHQVEPVDTCVIAHPAVLDTGVLVEEWPGSSEVSVVVPNTTGEALIRTGVDEPGDRVRERVLGRDYATPTDGFWQVHPAAAEALAVAVRDALTPRPGEVLLDLYAGSGLFAGVLAPLIGETGRVVAVEGDPEALAAAADNLRDLPWVTSVGGDVAAALRSLTDPVDLVVLDPPRAGAGAEVVVAITERRPRRVAYVSCDPATLARDLRTFAEHGYGLADLRAFDLFPHTHHVESLAVLEPN
jgi:tRNA/tmRNA/rRNA uracil-C5-methylase (TrmA/RlmC/RlmD family)